MRMNSENNELKNLTVTIDFKSIVFCLNIQKVITLNEIYKN